MISGLKSNYTVNCDYDINFEIEQRTLELGIDSSKIYDGKAFEVQSSDYYYIDGSLVTGHKISSKVVDEVIDIDSIINVNLVPDIFDINGNNVSSNYDITVSTQNITIEKQPLVIRSLGDSKVYNGEKLTNEQYEIVSGYLIDGHRIETEFDQDAYIINAGEAKNVFAIKIFDKKDKDVTGNYSIKYEFGTLKVSKREVVYMASDDNKVYDGTPLDSINEPQIISGALIDKHHIEHEYDPQTSANVGTYANTIKSITIYNEFDDDVTNNYLVLYLNGNITINKRDLIVTAGSQTFMFNGERRTYDNIDHNGVTGHNVTPTFTSDSYIEFVGVKYNVLEKVKIEDMNSNDVTDNYNITLVNGLLTMNPCDITIKKGSTEVVYDGIEHSFLSWEEPNIIDGLGYSIRANEQLITTITNVGSTENIFSVSIYNGYKDVTNNFNITYEYGTIGVIQKEITITTDSATKEYDGTPLVATSASATDLVKGHKIIGLEFDGSVTNVIDSEEGVLKEFIIVDALGNDVTSNYLVNEVKSGTLTITPKTAVIVGTTTTYEYNGSDQYYDGKDYESVEGLLLGHSISENSIIYNSNNTVRRVNDEAAPTEIEKDAIIILDENNIDITSNYNIIVRPGKLTITPAKLVVSPKTSNSKYGSSLAAINTADGNGLCDGDVISITELSYREFVDGRWVKLTNNPRNAGIYEANIISLNIKDDSYEDVTNCYEISYVGSEFEITPKEITISLGNVEEKIVYSGVAYLVSYTTNYQIVDGQFVGSDLINVKVKYTDQSGNYISPVNAGSYNVVFDDFEMASGLKSNYLIGCEADGKLTITKKEITGKVKDASKVYDGKELVASELENIVGLLSGHEILPKFTGSIKDYNATGVEAKLDIDNTIIVNKLGEDVTSNYDLSKITVGKLEIEKRVVTIYGKNIIEEYSGTINLGNEYEYVEGLIEGHTITSVTYKPLENTDVNIEDGKPVYRNINIESHGAVKLEPMEVDINIESHVIDSTYAENYKIEYVPGTILITPMVVEIEIKDLEPFDYEENKKYKSEDIHYTCTHDISNLIIEFVFQNEKGEEFTDGVTDVGYYKVIYNDFTADNKDNYTIICKNEGKLMVVAEITVTGQDVEYIYDGENHGIEDVTVSPGLRSDHHVVVLDSDVINEVQTKKCKIKDYDIVDENVLSVKELYNVEL